MFFVRPTRALGLMGLFAAVAFGANDANAQQIYRIVQPDGRVTFTDTRPLEPNAMGTAAPVASLAGTSAAQAALPFELREAANRYPVTLYTAAGCTPCGTGRAMLSARGIPFSEKIVSSNEDVEALKRLGAGTVPFLTIGAQQLKGFSEVEWAQFLDAAGYPKTSKLPAGYSQPPATPLVAAQEAQAPATARPREPARAAAPTPAPAADNPAGIRF